MDEGEEVPGRLLVARRHATELLDLLPKRSTRLRSLYSSSSYSRCSLRLDRVGITASAPCASIAPTTSSLS